MWRGRRGRVYVECSLVRRVPDSMCSGRVFVHVLYSSRIHAVCYNSESGRCGVGRGQGQSGAPHACSAKRCWTTDGATRVWGYRRSTQSARSSMVRGANTFTGRPAARHGYSSGKRAPFWHWFHEFGRVIVASRSQCPPRQRTATRPRLRGAAFTVVELVDNVAFRPRYLGRIIHAYPKQWSLHASPDRWPPRNLAAEGRPRKMTGAYP